MDPAEDEETALSLEKFPWLDGSILSIRYVPGWRGRMVAMRWWLLGKGCVVSFES